MVGSCVFSGTASVGDHALLSEQVAHQRAHLGVLGDHFGDDVARAGEGGCGVGHFLLGIDEGGGFVDGLAAVGLLEDAQGERLEPALAGDGGARAALGLERQVEILERRLGLAGADLFFELGRELALLLDRGEDRLASLLELQQVGAALLDGADLHLVETAGRLFAVARDEGDGRPLGEQLDDSGNVAR